MALTFKMSLPKGATITFRDDEGHDPVLFANYGLIPIEMIFQVPIDEKLQPWITRSVFPCSSKLIAKPKKKSMKRKSK